jgi:N utilization substance protein A
VSELGESIIQKLVTAGITTVEALADMTPEQLEEIPGIGEKTLEKISVAVRNYFGHFEEGEAPVTTAEAGEAPAEAGEPKEEGEAEVENAPAVEAGAEAEAENASEVVEEMESVAAVEANEDPESAMEEAVENVPDADEAPEKIETEGESKE